MRLVCLFVSSLSVSMVFLYSLQSCFVGRRYSLRRARRGPFSTKACPYFCHLLVVGDSFNKQRIRSIKLHCSQQTRKNRAGSKVLQVVNHWMADRSAGNNWRNKSKTDNVLLFKEKFLIVRMWYKNNYFYHSDQVAYIKRCTNCMGIKI